MWHGCGAPGGRGRAAGLIASHAPAALLVVTAGPGNPERHSRNTGTASTAAWAPRTRHDDMKSGFECVRTRWKPGFTASAARRTLTINLKLTGIGLRNDVSASSLVNQPILSE